MDFLAEAPYLAAVVPLGLAVFLFLFGRLLGKASAWVAMLGPLTVLLAGVACAVVVLGGEASAAPAPYVGGMVSSATWDWMVQGTMVITIGYAVDGLSALMLLVVGTVALMVMVFSVGYMADDPGFARYFTLLSLFTASMTGLVIANSLAGIFVAWELVGVCSYLLSGFWYRKPSAANAAMKAFLVTRVGDVGFLLGIAVLWQATGSLDLAEMTAAASGVAAGTIAVASALLFMGAAGKSAQFPLHIWLPDAMEGPTPVSALIHAATMVAAGVFLVARVWPLFEASPGVLQLILVVGVFTAVMAGTAATAQNDIKRVLAYSTISQLGFMFAALGLGAWEIAMFHLTTHAAFKALLFLGSGSVIHGTGTQDMREMGGLFKKMPITAVTWIVGAAALAGIPGLAGFFSKDEILAAGYHEQLWVVVLLWAASLFTAFYITRATMLTFFGRPRGDQHAHESGPTMTIPLVILATLAASAGYLATVVAELLGEEAHALEPPVAIVSATVAIVGVAAAVLFYRSGLKADDRLAGALDPVWRAWEHAYWFDGFVQRVVVRPTVVFATVLYEVVDRFVIDGIVEGTGTASRWFGRGMNAIENGDVQWYAALIGGGVIALLAVSYLIVMQDQLADTISNLGLW